MMPSAINCVFKQLEENLRVVNEAEVLMWYRPFTSIFFTFFFACICNASHYGNWQRQPYHPPPNWHRDAYYTHYGTWRGFDYGWPSYYAYYGSTVYGSSYYYSFPLNSTYYYSYPSYSVNFTYPSYPYTGTYYINQTPVPRSYVYPSASSPKSRVNVYISN